MTLRMTPGKTPNRILPRTLRIGAATLIAGLLLQGNAYALEGRSAAAQWQRGAEITFDVVILRPLRLAALGVGLFVFFPAAFMTLPGGRGEGYREAEQFFIVEPVRNVFVRPLGDF